MNFADFVALSVWPLLAFLVALHFRFRSNANFKLSFGIIVCILVAQPYIFLFSFIWEQSHIVRLDLFLGAVLLGCFLIWTCYYAVRFNPANAPRSKLLLVVPISVILGASAFIWGATGMYADYIQPRTIVEGEIQKLEIRRTPKGYKRFSIEINGKRFYVIEQDYNSLHVGDAVRLEIGRSSDYVFGIKKLDNKRA